MGGESKSRTGFYAKLVGVSALVVFSTFLVTQIELFALRQAFGQSESRVKGDSSSCRKHLVSVYRDRNGITHQIITDLDDREIGVILDEHDGFLRGIMRRYPKEE